MRAFPTLCLLLAVAALGACATIDRGVVDHVRVDSVPQGASVTMQRVDTTDFRPNRVSGSATSPIESHYREVRTCTTPCALPFLRAADVIVRVEADGYAPFEYAVMSSAARGAAELSAARGALTSTGAAAALGAAFAPTASFYGQLLTLGTGPSITAGQAAVATASATLLPLAAGVAVDFGTSANRNFFPNPAVVGLVRDGEPQTTDAMATALREVQRTVDAAKRACAGRLSGTPACEEADEVTDAARARMKALEDERKEALREVARQLKRSRKAQKEASAP